MADRKHGGGTRKKPENPGPSRGKAGGGAEDAARGGYHHGDLRRALLDAAVGILGEGGVDALTLREAARRAGVSHAAPYRHFADKDALLAAVAEEGFRLLYEEMLARARAHALGSAEYLVDSGVGYVLFAFDHPAHFRLMFGGRFGDGPNGPGTREQHPGLADAGGRAYTHLTTAVVEAQLAGVLKRTDREALTLAAWSVVHGLAMLVVDGQLGASTRESAEELARRTTRHLLGGIGRR